MIVNFILLFIFGMVTFAMWRQERPWGGLIMLLNILLAAALATAWFGPLARWAQTKFPSYTFLLDFVAIQSLFGILLLAFRETTDRLSKTRVRFRKPIEMAAGPIIGVMAAWIMVGFMAATLHTAPVPRSFVQATPDTRMFFGLAPDRWWLSWMRNASAHGPFGSPEIAFDPNGDFIERYATRRKLLEQHAEKTGSLRLDL